MTNRERLNLLDNRAYTAEVNAFAACSVRRYVDYEAWLDSDAEEYPIRGAKAVYHMPNGVDCDVTVVDTCNISCNTYFKIIAKLPALHDFDVLKVPADRVTIIDPNGFDMGDTDGTN